MVEVNRALSLLGQEISITDEVLGALSKCQSGIELDENSRNAIKQALVLLRGKEAKLDKSREAIAAHQQLHAEVEALQQKVAAGEKRIQECARRLTQAEAVLRGPLKDARRLLEAGRKAEAAEIDVGDVVDYAQRISGITSAPAYWKPGMAMVGFAPPAPRPEMMRAGALSAFAVAAGGNSLPRGKLLRIAQDLDKPPVKSEETGDARPTGGTAESDDDASSGDSQEKSRTPSAESPGKSRGGTRRATEGRDPSPAKLASRGASAAFARPAAPKRPKISLDLDDLDSDSDDPYESD